jgi:hypothetical protein
MRRLARNESTPTPSVQPRRNCEEADQFHICQPESCIRAGQSLARSALATLILGILSIASAIVLTVTFP